MIKEKTDMNTIKALDYFIRIAGTAALVLGLAFWTGKLSGLINLHQALGAGVVLCLWALAILAYRKGVTLGLVAGVAVWGLLTVALGVSQTGLLVGEFHWLVQVIHLILGLGAIAMGAVMARQITRQ
jgi:thiamine transporter ThiT